VAGIDSTEPVRTGWVRRHGRWLAGIGVACIALIAIGAAVSWHFSSAVLVPDRSDRSEQVKVERLPPGRIVLSRSEGSERPGVYGLEWTGGHAIVGAIRDSDTDTVTRRLRAVQGYLVPEMTVGIEADVYAGDPGQAFGLPFSDVEIPGELGPMPAWSVPGRTDAWAIVVHGINGTRQLGLRLVPMLHRTGLPTLLIAYREDLGAPPSPDGFHHMGLTEWRDLAAAARYALAHGARHLILVGYSMGGAIVAQFMERSPLAPRVSGLVLDAPALNWERILEFNATEMGLPGFSALPVEWAIGARIDADWDSLDALQHPDDFQLPILLFHGGEDKVVPISTSDEFAAELPRWVTYYAPRAPDTSRHGTLTPLSTNAGSQPSSPGCGRRQRAASLAQTLVEHQTVAIESLLENRLHRNCLGEHPLDFGKLFGSERAPDRRWRRPLREAAQDDPGLRQREANSLRQGDHLDLLKQMAVVAPLAADPRRSRQEARALPVTQGRGWQACTLGRFTDCQVRFRRRNHLT
jgi:uncharacterized protein